MSNSTYQSNEFYFYDPRLEMTAGGRIIVRLVAGIAYGLAAATTVIFSFSDINWLQSAGWLLALFLFNKLAHLGKPEKSLARIRAGRLNISHYLTPASYRFLENAFDQAAVKGGSLSVNLLRRLADRRDVRISLKRLDAPVENFIAKLDEFLKIARASKLAGPELKKEIAIVTATAFQAALARHGGAVEPKDLVAAVVQSTDPVVSRLLSIFNISEQDWRTALIFSHLSRPARLTGFIGRPFKVRHRIMNRSWTARPTPFLDRFSQDLTDLARSAEVGFLIGHAKEYDQLVDVLARPGNPNALLVGEAGCGKTTLIEHLAFQMVKDRVPPPLFDRRLVSLSLGNLVAGAAEGELQERVKKIINEIIGAGNIILYIPDIHNLVRTSGRELTAADMLLPAINSDAFSVVGASYPREFKQYIEANSDFAGAFEIIRVNEISEAEAVSLITYQSLILESQYKIVISFSAVKQAVILAHKYFHQKMLPASAEDLLKAALADVAGKRQKTLSADDVIAIAERRVNVPLHAVQQVEAEKLLNLEGLIHKRLIDQEEAVTAVSRAIREYRSGLARKGGPIANFLFVGPTGVGKTELAKILTQIQFGDQNLMLRFDMSEYQDKQSIFRFIGSPDGTVHGSLTDAVLEKPYSMILLDEFEKAHPDILNLFLQVFDDGRLTDNLGRLVDFQNTIIIATSNAHSELIKTELENQRPIAEIAEQLKKKLTDYFKAELLNRFSAVIVFKPLSSGDIQQITRIQLNDLAVVVRQNQGMELIFSPEAVQEVARLGYDPVFGARPLRRVISDRIRAVLAEKILRQEIARGASIKVIFENQEFKFISS